MSYGYSAKEIVSEKNIKLRLEDSIGYDPLVPRMWAQKKIDLLELEGGEEAKDELLRLGRKFNIATANTSLLVLTTLEQYLQHKIKPNRDALPDGNVLFLYLQTLLTIPTSVRCVAESHLRTGSKRESRETK